MPSALDQAKKYAEAAIESFDGEPARAQRVLLLAGVHALIAIADGLEHVERALDALDHRS